MLNNSIQWTFNNLQPWISKFQEFEKQQQNIFFMLILISLTLLTPYLIYNAYKVVITNQKTHMQPNLQVVKLSLEQYMKIL